MDYILFSKTLMHENFFESEWEQASWDRLPNKIAGIAGVGKEKEIDVPALSLVLSAHTTVTHTHLFIYVYKQTYE